MRKETEERLCPLFCGHVPGPLTEHTGCCHTVSGVWALSPNTAWFRVKSPVLTLPSPPLWRMRVVRVMVMVMMQVMVI